MGFPIESFTKFVSDAPLADAPGSSDMLALIQDGVTKKLPINSIPGLTPIVTVPETIITAGPTYNALLTDYFIGVNINPGAVLTINLPGAPGVGRPLIIKDIAGTCGGATPIIIANGTLDGNVGFILPFPYSCISLLSLGGTDWAILSKMIG